MINENFLLQFEILINTSFELYKSMTNHVKSAQGLKIIVFGVPTLINDITQLLAIEIVKDNSFGCNNSNLGEMLLP